MKLLSRSQIKRGYFFKTPDTYNQRWQWTFKYAYYTYPKDIESTRVETPESSTPFDSMFGTYFRDFKNRLGPGLSQFVERSHRCTSPFELYFLPIAFTMAMQFYPLDIGFKILAAVPAVTLYTRIRDKIRDPQPEETYLLDMLHSNPEIQKHFAVETTQIMDHQVEYTKGFPDENEFPEFKNKLFQFFNTDSHMTKGHYIFGDLESGATLKVNFETMPVRGEGRFQIGEPFFYFDVTAELNVKGESKKLILVDRQETLKKIRPFLIM